MEYKETLNLPQTSLEMRANATNKEPLTQKFWEDIKVYDKNLAQRDKANSFILHDGPPYLSSDKIHIGHALNKILKDIIIKYIKNGVIPYDRRECNFSLRGLEEDIYDLFDLQDGRKVKLGGIADRIDMRSNGNLRVIDYKSGRPKLEFNGIETLFNGENRSQNKYAFQTML